LMGILNWRKTMPDISMCADTRCPSRTICYRYCAEPEALWQSYGSFGRKKGQMRCEDYWDYRSVSVKGQKRAKSETATKRVAKGKR
jgi:hypothetical protein